MENGDNKQLEAVTEILTEYYTDFLNDICNIHGRKMIPMDCAKIDVVERVLNEAFGWAQETIDSFEREVSDNFEKEKKEECAD